MGMKDSIKGMLGLNKGHVVNKPSEIQVGVHQNKVVIIFEQPVTSISFDKMQLLELIETLTSKLPTIKK